MWIKVDDGFPEHRKVLAAGRHLGRAGAGRVIAIWTVGMCYSGRALLDGIIPADVVKTWKLYDKNPLQVADSMALLMPDGNPGLLIKIEGGYRFHDYDDYQPSASSIKEKRQKDRARKRAARQDSPRKFPSGVHADSLWNPESSRARDPDPSPKEKKDHRAARGPLCAKPVENARVLKALIWCEVSAAATDPTAPFTYPDLLERIKTTAARAGLVYAVDGLRDQVEHAMVRHQRRRPA